MWMVSPKDKVVLPRTQKMYKGYKTCPGEPELAAVYLEHSGADTTVYNQLIVDGKLAVDPSTRKTLVDKLGTRTDLKIVELEDGTITVGGFRGKTIKPSKPSKDGEQW